VILFTPGGQQNLVYSDPDYDSNTMYIDQMNAFIDFTNGSGYFDSSFESALQVMGLIEAIRASESSLNWVKVEEIK
jgi:hypothetical protein